MCLIIKTKQLDQRIKYEQNTNGPTRGRTMSKDEKKDREGSKITTVLDLYCGSGNLSLHLAKNAKNITGVEANKGSIDVAKYK